MSGVDFPEKAWLTDFSRFVSENPEFLSYATFREIAYSIHISLNHRIVYFEVPKNASSSIKTMLHRLEYGDPDFEHTTFADVHGRDFSPLLTPFQVHNFRKIITGGEFLLFTVFRDPFERLLSGYIDKVVNNGQFHKEIRATTGTSSSSAPQFKEFIYWLAGQKVSDMDQHWKPQCIQSHYGTVPDLQVFSMDRLDSLSLAIQRHVGTDRFVLERTSPHKTGSKFAIDEHYDEAAKELVRRKYADDFAIWQRTNQKM